MKQTSIHSQLLIIYFHEIRIPNISMNFSTDQNVFFSFFKWFKNAQSSQTLLYSYYSKTINILAALYLSIHGPWVLTDIIMEKFLQNPLKGFIIDKVWVFWGGHKIWKYLRCTLDKSVVFCARNSVLVKKSTKIFQNKCGQVVLYKL